MARSDRPADASAAQIETAASDEWRATVALHGDIDAEAAPALHTELHRHLDARRCVIRIDAGGVTFIDSTAMGELLSAAERCADLQGSLILTNVPTQPRTDRSTRGHARCCRQRVRQPYERTRLQETDDTADMCGRAGRGWIAARDRPFRGDLWAGG
jgi:anti-anti-sigma factor